MLSPRAVDPWLRDTARAADPLTRRASRTWTNGLAVVLLLAAARTAGAQLPVPASSQFDITGFIQAATLDNSCAAPAHCGGTLTVNGHVVTVPRETIVILPANALTWQELFAQAPAPYTGVATGMAINDVPAPLTTYEAHVVGNRVSDRYIAGLVYIAQHGLNSGQGFINYMDYSIGEMRVGGVIGDPTTGTRVRLNDPTGRYGRAMTPDRRFTVDADNPTIAAGTGFPMCFPRESPGTVNGDGTTGDALCPEGQRVGQPATIQMNDPLALPGVFPDATKQAPFEVGDYVTFAGTLVTDSSTPTTGPWPATGAAGTYVSAHTISNNIAIYTWPGRDPAYVSTEVALIGTGGLTVLGAGEAAIRTRFEGMTTDPSRNVHLYGIDLDPLTGAALDRDWGTIGVDPGPPNGAVKGRWRFRPPCTASVATDKACTPPPGGTFLPPTREVRAVIEGQQSQGCPTASACANPASPVSNTALKSANGLVYGQYHAPILEYIFPENIPGTPIVENNFNAIPFLAQGGYTSSGGTIASQLSPWPSNVVPTPACLAPTASAGGPYTVAFDGTVSLVGSGSGSTPLTFAWTASSGSLTNANTATPTFSAVGATSPVTVTLTVSNGCGSATATSSITVNPLGTPTVNSIAPQSVFSGASGSFVVSGSDPNVPAEALTFSATQTGTPALINLAVTSTSSTTATITFVAPTLPIGQVTPAQVTVSVTARNTGGATSAPVSTTVTVNPLTDALAVTSAEYRTSKQRLVINATSSVVSSNVVLKLQPYLTTNGTTYNPDPAVGGVGNVFTNNGGGLYIIDLVGAPRPACNPTDATLYASPCSLRPLDMKSNLGGDSGPVALTRIRQ